jgi:N-methylhydantoinase B
MLLSAQTLDPVTVEVVRNKLDGIANEMELTLLKSSFSPIVKEGLDASASLFTRAGRDAGQAIAIPIHLATLIPCVARFPHRVSNRGDARRRHLLHERPVSRRHASA